MGVSIIIPTLNRGSDLIETLNFLTEQLKGNNEVIIVDQSDPYPIEIDIKLQEILRVHQNTIKYFKIEKKSAGRARNFGVTKSSYDNLVFIDDDVILPKDFLEKYQHYLNKYPDLDAIAGKVCSQEGNVCNDLPNEYHDKHVGFLFRPMDYCSDIDNADLGSCNMLIKKNTFEKLNGFDEKMLRLEDSDLSTRFQQKKFKSKYIADISLIHKASEYGATRHVTMHQRPYPSKLFWTEYFYFTLKNFGLLKGRTFIAFWMREKILTKRIIFLPWNFVLAMNEVHKGFSAAKKRIKYD